jgi:hypothetical protein
MTRSKLFTSVSMLAVFAGSMLAPIAANADGSWNGGGGQIQAQKNGWRDAALVSAAVGIYGLATHQKSAEVVGAVGTAISLSQYDRDQKIQNDRDCRDYGYSRSVVIVPDRQFDNHNRDNHNRDFRGGNNSGQDFHGTQRQDRH